MDWLKLGFIFLDCTSITTNLEKLGSKHSHSTCSIGGIIFFKIIKIPSTLLQIIKTLVNRHMLIVHG